MIKLILTDLDDTLIPVGAPCASERARAAIHALLDRGIHFGPVSGRIPSAMGWMFADDEACFATGAFSNGQILHLDGREVSVKELPYEALVHTQEILDATGHAALAIYDVAGDGRATLYSGVPDKIRQNETIFTEASGRVLTKLDPSVRYIKANVHVSGTFEERCALRDHLNEEVPELGFVLPSLTAPLIDISPAGWDKGSSVRALAEALGVGLDEVVCFGDSENDLSMIEATPNGVAVANAAPEIERAARWHIGASKDDAVAAALEDIARAADAGTLPSFMQE
ncbi:MAG: HAD family hydrolase [Atopobiaceae bacterium]